MTAQTILLNRGHIAAMLQDWAEHPQAAAADQPYMDSLLEAICQTAAGMGDALQVAAFARAAGLASPQSGIDLAIAFDTEAVATDLADLLASHTGLSLVQLAEHFFVLAVLEPHLRYTSELNAAIARLLE